MVSGLAILSLFAGMVLTHNGTTWFDGENSVAHFLNAFGVVVLLINLVIIVFALWAATRGPKRVGRRFR